MTVDNTTPAPDAATPADVVPHRWWALVAVALGVSLVIMDATVVNVALPVIIEDLHLNATQAEWMNAIYSLVFAALLLTVGRVGDIVGRRRVFLVGMVVFVLASVLAGFAGGPTALIGARLLQGLGARLRKRLGQRRVVHVNHGIRRAQRLCECSRIGTGEDRGKRNPQLIGDLPAERQVLVGRFGDVPSPLLGQYTNAVSHGSRFL